MSVMPFKMLPVLLLWIVFAVPAAQAGQVRPDALPPRPFTSVTLGQNVAEFFFARGDSNFVYGYAGPATSLVVRGDKSRATLVFGTRAADVAQQRPGQRYLDLSLLTGDNLYLTRSGDPVQVSVPLRLHLAYQGLQVDTSPLGPGARRVRGLHLVHTGVGAGGSVLLQSPPGLPLVGRRGQVRATWLTTLGGTRDAEQELSATRFTRTTDIDLEVRIHRVLGSELGLAAGYTYRAHQWYAGSMSAVRDAFGGLHAASVDQRARQHSLRVGLVL
ncbi:hypothetical protein AWN76_001675 [Rhodothermaceae bacterium RA]|nr:hypothetical protein AWN76_001675 [Rhodothermaceae bacterium RA]